MDFQNYTEYRAESGYGSTFLVKKQDESKYSWLLPLESTPSVQGTTDSFEFDILQSKSKGKVKGKKTLDDKEVEFLLHRDNIVRLEAVKDETLDFMQCYFDGKSAWGYTGTCTISFRANDATNDVRRGTFTVHPMSLNETPILEVRDIIEETICFSDTVPAYIDGLTSTPKPISFTLTQGTATVDTVIKDKDGNTASDFTATQATVADKTVSISFSSTASAPKYAIAYVTASKTGYASWTTTIALSAG